MNRFSEILISLQAAGRAVLRLVVDYGGFLLGTALGVLLAFTFYIGLRPRVEEAVKQQETEQRTRALAAAPPRPAAAPPKPPAQGQAPTQLTPTQAGTAKLIQKEIPAITGTPTPRRPPRPTRLRATPAPAGGLSRQTGQTLLANTLLFALAAGAMAWYQFRKQPLPDVAKSKVLEALLLLRAHQRMQQRLGLTPRQIKRFNSKARVQHSQLRALAQRTQAQALPFAFPVSSQVQAFQLLLLLEEGRLQPGALLQADRATFVQQLTTTYAQHPELAEARREAASNDTINKPNASFPAATADQFADLGHQVPQPLLEQLYEMNSVLLV